MSMIHDVSKYLDADIQNMKISFVIAIVRKVHCYGKQGM